MYESARIIVFSQMSDYNEPVLICSNCLKVLFLFVVPVFSTTYGERI